MQIKGINNNILYILLAVVLVITLILIIISLMNTKVMETFICEESQNEPVIQRGISGISESGTITFPKTFNNVPNVFTQIVLNSGNNTDEMVFGINVSNITQKSFDYKKYKINLAKSEDFSMTDLQPSKTEQFQWIAFG
jgi:hypothetical protein